MVSTHPDNNNSSRVGETNARDRKIAKIVNIIAESFLGLDGESCSYPSYKIPSKFNNSRDKENITNRVLFKINIELVFNQIMSEGCEDATLYKREVNDDNKREIVKNYINRMFEISTTGGARMAGYGIKNIKKQKKTYKKGIKKINKKKRKTRRRKK